MFLALILSVFLFAFGITWYAAVYPLGRCRGAGTTLMASASGLLPPGRFCDVEPTDALTSNSGKRRGVGPISGGGVGCGSIEAALASNATANVTV